jgi:hypothetical protein
MVHQTPLLFLNIVGVPPKNTTKPDAKSDLRLAKDLFFCHNTNIILRKLSTTCIYATVIYFKINKILC